MLFPVEIDEQWIKAIVQYWDLFYRCFTFNEEDITLTIGKYSVILRLELPNSIKIFWKQSKKFEYRKEVAQIMEVEVWEIDQETKKK